MKSYLRTGTIPGTVLPSDRFGGITGNEFIEKIFFVTDGIMLSQIREITGIDGTTLQNWIKRGWVPSPQKKTYSREHLARILLINMMRDTVELSKIVSLLGYTDGGGERVTECELYDIVCSVLSVVSAAGDRIGGFDDIITDVTDGYAGLSDETKKRVLLVVRIIVVSYYATTMKATADYMLSSLIGDSGEK